MNKFISQMIDYYALNKLHRKKSISSHYKNILSEPIRLEKQKQYFAVDKMMDMDLLDSEEEGKYTIGTFRYPSLIQTEWESNNVVTGKYFHVNKDNKEKISVIMVHGWRTEGFGHFDKLFLEDFKKNEFDLYYYTLPYHLDRQPLNSLYSGEYMVSADVEGTLQAIQQAVVDLRALVQWIKKNKGGKVLLIGISLGGFLTNLTATVEAEVNGLVSIMYANALSFSIWKTPPGKYIKKDLVANKFTYQQLKDYWNIIDPSCYQPLLPKENILLISGKYDQYVWLEDTDRLWMKWNKPKRQVYDCGHAGIVLCRDQIRKDVNIFINRF